MPAAKHRQIPAAIRQSGMSQHSPGTLQAKTEWIPAAIRRQRIHPLLPSRAVTMHHSLPEVRQKTERRSGARSRELQPGPQDEARRADGQCQWLSSEEGAQPNAHGSWARLPAFSPWKEIHLAMTGPPASENSPRSRVEMRPMYSAESRPASGAHDEPSQLPPGPTRARGRTAETQRRRGGADERRR